MPIRPTGSYLPAVARERLHKMDAGGDNPSPDPWPDLLSASFPQQRSFIEDDTSFTTAVCSRRAGKTIGCSAKLVKAARMKPGSVSLYLTLSRLNAKRIVWPSLLELNRTYGLGGEPNETELYIRFPNGSFIYLAGANDRSEIEKYRGMPLAQVIIDEAQALPGYIEELVDAVLAPALMDFSGALALIGTPAPVPVGYFHRCATSPEWSHHRWTVFDNPHIERKSGKSPRDHLAGELKRRGITERDPIIRREWFGEWMLDENSLVFRYDAARNGFIDLPVSPKGWEYVVGVDLGFDDADAIAVLAWSDDFPQLWLVEEWAGPKQTITQLGDRLRPLYDRYKPLGVVMDTGGLGKKIAQEITNRTEIPVEAAEKERKLEHIELLNDALRSGRLFARPDGRFAQDALLVEWDRSNPEKPKISDRFHSDICDAVLYAYRKSLHWTHQPAPAPAPLPGTQAWNEREERAMIDAAESRLERALDDSRERPEGVGDSSDWESYHR